MWEQIRSNRIKSIVLVAAMACVLLAIGYFIGLAFFGSATGGLIVALIIWGIMSLIAYFEGDSIFLALSRARKIERDDHPRLYNVVEEMKLASGLEHMPAIYIIDDPALNAFATGRDPKKAAVAVTSGLLQKLNRDELQGVIGHEIAHVKNRDVLLMTMCGVLLGTIVMISWYMTHALFWGGMSGRRGGSGGGQAQIILLLVGLVLMIIAPILAQLIYFAISRKREYLADASSAQFTRYPEGLASALEKIGGSIYVGHQVPVVDLHGLSIVLPGKDKGQGPGIRVQQRSVFDQIIGVESLQTLIKRNFLIFQHIRQCRNSSFCHDSLLPLNRFKVQGSKVKRFLK